MALRYINWNIKCYCNIDKICEYLSKIISKEACVVALQEVMPNRFAKLFDCFSSDFHLIYSITYRKPDEEFDTDNIIAANQKALITGQEGFMEVWEKEKKRLRKERLSKIDEEKNK